MKKIKSIYIEGKRIHSSDGEIKFLEEGICFESSFIQGRSEFNSKHVIEVEYN